MTTCTHRNSFLPALRIPQVFCKFAEQLCHCSANTDSGSLIRRAALRIVSSYYIRGATQRAQQEPVSAAVWCASKEIWCVFVMLFRGYCFRCKQLLCSKLGNALHSTWCLNMRFVVRYGAECEWCHYFRNNSINLFGEFCDEMLWSVVCDGELVSTLAWLALVWLGFAIGNINAVFYCVVLFVITTIARSVNVSIFFCYV